MTVVLGSSAGAASAITVPIPIASRSTIFKQGFPSGLGTTGHTGRHIMKALAAGSDLFFLDSNFGWGGTDDAPNDLLLSRRLILPSGKGYDVTWQGNPTVRITNRALVRSDQIGADVAAGDLLSVRSFVRGDALAATGDTTNGSAVIANWVPTNGVYMGPNLPVTGAGIPASTKIVSIGEGTVTLSNNCTATASGVAISATAMYPADWFSDTGNGQPWYLTGRHLLDTDPTTGGNPGAFTNTYYYSPLGLYARKSPAQAGPVFYLLGDSNFHGQGDDQTPPATNDLSGLARRALNGRWPYMHAAVSGISMRGVESKPHPILTLAEGCNVAILGMLTNDLGTGASAATIVASVNNVAGWLKARGVQKVIACTAGPGTDSTDNWVTVANQTPQGQEAIRTAINTTYRTLANMNAGGTLSNVDWIADCASPVEVNAAGAATPNGGRWNVIGGQARGTAVHYTSYGHIAAAAIINDAINHAVLGGERGGISQGALA